MNNNIKFKNFRKKNISIKIKSRSNMYLYISKGEVIVKSKDSNNIVKTMRLFSLKKNKVFYIDAKKSIFNLYYLNAKITNND